ncbi:histidine kinase [Flavobacterium sp.]|uniref:sensor histidine kinase n=1 Tax=Flavobacterium sp. TaxID=239 RepID=UPI0026075A0E|nr:histidine kinase [Flavobacterium sp.]
MKTIYKIALITSPALALSGVSPLYIFDKLNLSQSCVLWLGLTANVFIFWCINIFLLKKIPHNEVKRNIVSFFLIFLTHIPKVFFEPELPFSNVVHQYFVYPILTTITLNTIILILLKTQIAEHKNREIERQYEQLEIINLESQKQLLLQQLQPHFLFNSLSILKSLISENSSLAENYVMKLSDFLRYTANIGDNAIVSVADELKFTEDYVALLRGRFDSAIAYENQIDTNMLRKKIPILGLQTLVENAVKHNKFTEEEPLNIKIVSSGNQIIVSNNINEIITIEKSGHGLINLNKRLLHMNNSNIEIYRTKDTFCAILTLHDL